MAIKVRVPSAMRSLTSNQSVVETRGASLGDALANLASSFPDLKARLLDEQGRRRKFVNLFVNGQDIRQLQHEATPLKDNDEIEVLAVIAGG